MLGAEAAVAVADVAAASNRTRSDNNKPSSSNNPRDRASVVLAFPVTVVDGVEVLVVVGTKTFRMPTLLRVDKRTGVI